MRVSVNRRKILEELYVIRDKEQEAYAKAMEKYTDEMDHYFLAAEGALKSAIHDIQTGRWNNKDKDEDDDERIWEWSHTGINVLIDDKRPSKPHDVNYRLLRTISMLERHDKESLSIDEGHDIIKLLT
jgi:hypothetical protein